MKRLNDLFAIQAFKDCKIVSGKKGLNRIVEFVNISDTPDIARFLKSNELLLTTGYGFKDNPDILNDFITHLSEINVSGLIIKENRFIKKIPVDVINLSNKLNFPIMLLTGKQTLGELSNKIISFLSGYKSEELFYAIHLENKFTNMMMRGFDLDYLIDRLSISLNTTIALVDDRFDVVYISKNKKNQDESKLEFVMDLLESNFTKYKHINNVYIECSDNIENFTFSTFPVAGVYDTPNILIVFNSDKIAHPISEVAIEQVSHSISFTLVKSQIAKDNAFKIKSNFFADMIGGRVTDKENFLQKTSSYGLKDNCKYLCIVGNFDINNPYKNRIYIPQNKMYFASSYIVESLEKEAKKLNLDVISFYYNMYFIAIVQVDIYNETIRELIEKYLKQVQSRAKGDMTVSFGISVPVRSILQMKDSYLNSLVALNHGYDSEKHNFIEYYRLKEAKDILFMIPERILSNYCESILKSLVTSGNSDNDDLLNTLRAFIENRFDISKTSRELFVHRNTVKYRITKCEELLGISLHSPDDVFCLQLALQIKGMLKSN